MELESRENRDFVRYTDYRDRVIFTEADKFVDDAEDFSDRISDSELPEGFDGRKNEQAEEIQEKITGVEGYKRLSKAQKKEYLKKQIPDADE